MGLSVRREDSYHWAGRGDAGISAVAGFLYASSQLNYNDQ